MRNFNLCIAKPNKSIFSETFIQEHINRLSGNKRVIYGGAFPLYDHNGRFLIRSKAGLAFYLIQKRLLKKLQIDVRTQALRDYLKREKIDVVLAEYGMVGAMIAEACKEAGVPLVIHFHGADAHHQPTVNKYRPLYNNALSYASGIVAVSKDMVDTLVELGADREKISWIPCGVDIKRFKPVEELTNLNVFLSVGRFVGKKSPLSLVKAFELVLKQLPDSKLFMVGDGPLYSEVKACLEDNNLQESVTLTGVRNSDEIRELFKRSKCFIQHSVTTSEGDMEGSPVTIIEAGASALPIVSTRHAGIKEAVIDAETGFLVDEYDIAAMADKMIQVAMSQELAVRMGRAGREHVEQNYSIEGQVSKLNQVINQALR